MKQLILLCSLLTANFVYAHNAQTIKEITFSESAICPKKQTVLLGKMNLSAGTFKYLNSEGSNVCNALNSKMLSWNSATPMLDCGQFDDWRLAYEMGNKMCQSLLNNMRGFSHTITTDMPVFTRFEGPYEFKGDSHHQTYEASMGVTLACYMCDVSR
ncbi:hypothetical protein [Pseudoalteromonas sp. MMG022]|uniref:hypothetical protein n=1 Tax=Pseudoalteromonas sp. MMG022 TaxID=2909978 RepID=UPI001F3E7E1A|nr:hypothetical protein [Pseudoalteromonas sp. MMG022]MCF6436663.1 hypothetical protein [Pseudoalteromonas sp. MMG022]